MQNETRSLRSSLDTVPLFYVELKTLSRV